MNNKKVIIAHLSMLMASAGWGLMAPLGKQAMAAGVAGIDLVLAHLITMAWLS